MTKLKQEILIPDYFMKFSCIGPACEDTCCAGWKVTVDKDSFKKYRSNKIPSLKEELKKNISRERSNPSIENYGKIKMDEEGKCTLLAEDGLCKIQVELGESYLCNTCAVYPRNINKVDHRKEKSLTPSCPEAARLILENQNGIEFIIDEEPSNVRGNVLHNIQTDNNPMFWDLRMFTIELLQDRRQSLEIRLIVLGLFYQKIHTMEEKDLLNQLEHLMQRYKEILSDEEQLQSILNLPHNIAFQMNVVKALINYRLSEGVISQRYIDCLNEMIKGLELEDHEAMDHSIKLYEESFSTYYVPFIQRYEYILENYLVNYVFKNLFPSDQSDLFESYVMLILNFSMIKLHIIGMCGYHKGMNKESVIKLIQSYSKTIEHNPVYLQDIREMLKESGYSTMAHMIVLIKS